ncbi:MAG: FAD-binding oxidoreductase [Actinobacteria bacterium]|nr:FAD-binding oxidoreductase [Actinomycetota bacterium]MBU1944921.1 FAD-binding oxidoreductase [Actinomycetota bacterium]MBU2688153.1 FAD-binding oxidoreductase [Actinomycetota bacterium]
MTEKITSQMLVSGLGESTRKEILARIEAVVGAEWVSDDPVFGASWGRDQFSRIDQPTFYPDFVVLPGTTLEVADLMKIANEHGLEVCPAAAGAGSFSNLLMHKGGILIDTRRLDRILEIDEEAMIAFAEAGVTHSRLQVEAKKRGLRCDVPGGPSSNTPASNLSQTGEHFGGSRYGQAHPKILGVELVTPTGRIVRTGMLAFPGSRGGTYGPDWDLSTLPNNSCGLAGVITRYAFKLFPLGDVQKYRKHMAFGFFTDLGDALHALSEIAVEDLAKTVCEAGPKYYAGLSPTSTLEDYWRVLDVMVVSGGYTTVLAVEMEGTTEQVAYQKAKVDEILERHNAGGHEFASLFDMMFNKPVMAAEVRSSFANLLDADVPEHWVHRVAELFDISENACRAFCVGGQMLMGPFTTIEKGIASKEIFMDMAEERGYPELDKGLWASYGVGLRGSSGKLQELDIHFDRLDVDSLNARDRFMPEFTNELCKKKLLFTYPSMAAAATTLEYFLGDDGVAVWLGIRHLLDPNGVMHKHFAFDFSETEI